MRQLLVIETEPVDSLRLLLEALDAEFSVCAFEQAFAGSDGAIQKERALILSESHLVSAAQRALSQGGTLERMLATFSQVLVFPFAGTPAGTQALSELAGTIVKATAVPAVRGDDYEVRGPREMCGPFAGLRFKSGSHGNDFSLSFEKAKCKTDPIVTAGTGGLMVKLELARTHLFVIASSAIFEVKQLHRKNLQASECFSGLVPLLFFLRHSGISLPEISLKWANWIIDDPNLRTRYGFLDLAELAKSADQVGASVTVGFIPWNYRRNSSAGIKLFQSHWPRLSICMHGCDHTQGEFSMKSVSQALQLVALGVKRMRQLESETSLSYEKVMVFPQGIFSAATMGALRQSELLSAVNTELIDSQSGLGVTGAELLRPAITSLGGFPLFMRRPPGQPLANFALDLLLGKPCLVVTHHKDFQAGMQAFTSLVESLNSMDRELVWTTLEKGTSATYSVRRNLDRSKTVRLFAARTAIDNNLLDGPLTFVKSESLLDKEFQVLWNGEPIHSVRGGQGVMFSGGASATQPAQVEVRATPPAAVLPARQSFKYRCKVAARRHLSELRDNYLDKMPRLKAGSNLLRRLIGHTK